MLFPKKSDKKVTTFCSEKKHFHKKQFVKISAEIEIVLGD